MKNLLKQLNYEIDALTKEFDILFEHPTISKEHYHNLFFISGVIAASTTLLFNCNEMITEENEKILEYKIVFNKFLKKPSSTLQVEFQLKCPKTLHKGELNNYLNKLDKCLIHFEECEDYLKCATIKSLEDFLKNKITT